MERAPESLDDLQPQDLSTSSISTVIDLTRKSEECVSGVTSLNSMVKRPVLGPNLATCDPQLTLSESTGSSDGKLQSGGQIHPDEALSHTTVTLSYVSRSHVCTAHDSLSRHSPLSGLPAISKLPLCSPPDSEALRERNQHYSERADKPVDLGIPTERFQSSSQAQLGSEDNVPAKENHEVKSKVISRDSDEPFQEGISLSLKNSGGLENGDGGGWRSPVVCVQAPPETLVPATRDDGDGGGCEVVFVMSKKPDPAVVPDSIGARDLCLLNREYVSPLEDPVSPSATSQDGAEDAFDLPRASSSEPSDREEQPQEQGTVEPLVGAPATEDARLSGDLGNEPVGARVNGNATALQRTLNEKKLPARSGRGTRLEAIVMNINSSSYKVSGCIRTNQKPSPSRAAECDAKITGSESNGRLALEKTTGRDKASLLEDAAEQTVIPVTEGSDNNCNTDRNKDSTSDSLNNHSETSQTSMPPKSPPPAADPEQLSGSEPAADTHVARVSPRTQTSAPPKKSKGKAKPSGGGSRQKTRKGRNRSQGASMFSPKEPEIKLRYITYKEERRESRVDGFSPFVHVERRQSSPSLCTVVNYSEEVGAELRKGQQVPSATFVTGAVPSTSCLQLGRASAHGQHQRSLVCCLCGQSANAMDLGDLHGPYYPEGYRPAAKGPAGIPGLKEEEDDSDSDSSSSTVKERGRKRAVRRLTLGPQLWAGDGTGSPAAKRARSDGDPPGLEDWYSAPVLPLQPCEYWLHEDCGIWSAGVYLVKGRVYGLEEAVRAAEETKCSACRRPGATLGCTSKSCPNKYHYRCALESDCILIEENFSMKCRKHKKKTVKMSPGNRREDR